MDSSLSINPFAALRNASSESKYRTVDVNGHFSFGSIDTNARVVRRCCVNRYADHDMALARKPPSTPTSIRKTLFPSRVDVVHSVASYKIRLACSRTMAFDRCAESAINR